VTPISTQYRDRTVLECPPNEQGVAALIILNILSASGLSIADLALADRIHLFAEATKLGYHERNT
jgi:gamma-glutamyltranspeptidase/glutathione hydrolase